MTETMTAEIVPVRASAGQDAALAADTERTLLRRLSDSGVLPDTPWDQGGREAAIALEHERHAAHARSGYLYAEAVALLRARCPASEWPKVVTRLAGSERTVRQYYQYWCACQHRPELADAGVSRGVRLARLTDDQYRALSETIDPALLSVRKLEETIESLTARLEREKEKRLAAEERADEAKSSSVAASSRGATLNADAALMHPVLVIRSALRDLDSALGNPVISPGAARAAHRELLRAIQEHCDAWPDLHTAESDREDAADHADHAEHKEVRA